MGCFHRKRKSPPLEKKKAKPEKEPPDPKKYLKEYENYVSPDLMATDKNEY